MENDYFSLFTEFPKVSGSGKVKTKRLLSVSKRVLEKGMILLAQLRVDGLKQQIFSES
jgi:hypothetical protein